MEVQRHTVPHFKGLIELYLDLQAQGRDSTFTICHALVKRAILHYIKACGRFVFSTTVRTDGRTDVNILLENIHLTFMTLVTSIVVLR